MKFPKERQEGAKLHGRWYDDACSAAFAMELIGERWALPIVRELMLGGRRFSDIRASLPGLSAKVLTERLESLEAAGVVGRMILAPPTPAKLYALTPWGMALEPVLHALSRWAVQSPRHDPRLPLTPVALMLSLRTMFDPEAAKGWAVSADFAIGPERFRCELADDALAIHRADAAEAPAQIAFRAPDANAYLWVFYGKQPLGSPGLTLEARGDYATITRFIALFQLPPKHTASP